MSLESRMIADVPVYVLKPDTIAPENRNRLLVHVHGGGYVVVAGKAATTEAILMAHYGQVEVISVDYRMPPDFPFPAAVDDTVAVWKAVIHSHAPAQVGLFGTSAGGGFEGQSHAQYLIVDDAPESAVAWREVSTFFNQHLEK